MGDPKSRSQVDLRRSARLLAQLGPRKSPRLSGITVPETASLAIRKTRKPSQCSDESSQKTSQSREPPRKLTIYYAGPCPIYVDRGGPQYLNELRRTTRQANARYFWLAYKNVYKNLSDGRLNIKEMKHVVLSDRIISNPIDKSHGIIWVSVHGVRHICTVFKNRMPDMIGIDMLRGPSVLTFFGKHILSDVEDLADSAAIGGKKPFAVVSVTRGSDIVEENCYKASGDELDEDKAKNFLQGKMNSESALTKEETVKTAVAAFHYLFKKKLKPEEFRVLIFYDNGYDDVNWDLSNNEIKKYLNHIDKTDEEREAHSPSTS